MATLGHWRGSGRGLQVQRRQFPGSPAAPRVLIHYAAGVLEGFKGSGDAPQPHVASELYEVCRGYRSCKKKKKKVEKKRNKNSSSVQREVIKWTPLKVSLTRDEVHLRTLIPGGRLNENALNGSLRPVRNLRGI